MSVAAGPSVPSSGLIMCLDASNRKSMAGVGADRVGQTLRIKGVDDDIQYVSLSGVVSIVENKTIYYTL
jgi:hypothetical protein